MTKIIDYINKLSKFHKVTILILTLGLILILSIGIPSLARLKNRVTINGAPIWNGSVATSYNSGSGTEPDPYIISNGEQLAYFSKQLENNNYENTYFALSNDIILNKGIFNYDDVDKIKYTINEQTYYVALYSNEYYENSNREGEEIGSINIFNSLSNFKGYFEGNSFIIYGVYITDEEEDELALFTNLQGNVKNLYVENSIIYGGNTTGGIASSTNNASLKNILFDGFVIGKNSDIDKNVGINLNISSINLQNTEKIDNINLTNNIPFIGGDIISTSITGNYSINGASESEVIIKINGTTISNGSFEVNLGSSILNSIDISSITTSQNNPTLSFSNVSYNVVYKYGVAGGIIGISKNTTTLENTINKATIYGYSNVGGLVGVTTNALNIKQSYNTGIINSGFSGGGLIATIEKSSGNVSINKSYNVGNTIASNVGGLVGIISNNTGSISIEKSFNAFDNACIDEISGSSVSVNNVYFISEGNALNVGSINGSFTSTSLSNLKTKNYVLTNLIFNEFVDFDDLETNTENVWIYDNNSLPILFVDDVNDPIANLHVSVYSWNNYSNKLSSVQMSSNITFSVEDESELNPTKEKYYYIRNSNEPLTKSELSGLTWNEYDDVVRIRDEGSYVIYVKVIDYDDNVTYINSDVLILNLSTTLLSVSLNEDDWSNFRYNIENIYLDRSSEVVVDIHEASEISNIKYFVSDEVLDISDLNELNETQWSIYEEEIDINEVGKYIVYIKVIDIDNNVFYINTDYIILDGYTENNLIIGRNSSNYNSEHLYITNKSTISLNISYLKENADDLSNHTHNLISSIPLPLNSKITLIDEITNKVYEYKVATSTNSYSFSLFKAIGTDDTSKYYQESSYYNNGTISENFTIILDLFDTNISTNYENVELSVILNDSNSNNVRPTIYESIKKVNIYSTIGEENSEAKILLSTDYTGSIKFNSNSSNNINLTSIINYKKVGNFKVIDTTYENKKMGISIKLVNENNEIVDREYLKSIGFKIGNKSYYPSEDNVVRINLGNGIEDVSKILTISTNENSNNLGEGNYSFKISGFASYDGNHYDELNSNELNISAVSVAKTSSTHKFNVLMDEAQRIIFKSNEEFEMQFKILQKELRNPNIKVSLYKKAELTAYNQTYTLVDLASYVSNSLDKYEDNIYWVTDDPVEYDGTEETYNNFELNLITENFENNGYKFVFDIYEGAKKVSSIEKYFIVRQVG